MLPKVLFVLIVFIAVACNNTNDVKDDNKKIAKNDSSTALTKPVNPFAPQDISPMDMSYLPDDYPQIRMSDSLIGPPIARVIYSRPQLQGRKMFGNILPYGEAWRLGANESTEVQFFRPVTIMGKSIKPGRYSLYCIPFENEWTIALNKNIDSWGLRMDSTQDLYRFNIHVERNPFSLEFFTIVFEKAGSGADLLFGWETTVARLPIRY